MAGTTARCITVGVVMGVLVALGGFEPAAADPPAPFNVTATQVGPTSIQLSWEGGSGGSTATDSFEIHWRLGARAATGYGPLPAATTTWTVSNLTPGARYAFEVHALDADGNRTRSPYSNEIRLPVTQASRRATVSDGPAYALDVGEGTTYLGGDFSYIGARTGPVVVVSAEDGAVTRRPAIGDPSTRLTQVEPDGAGGWYVAGTISPGTFGMLGGGYFARLDDDLQEMWSLVGYDGATVNAFEVHEGAVLLAGGFDLLCTDAGPSSPTAPCLAGNRRQLAAVDAVTGALLPWAPQLLHPQGEWRDIEVVGSQVYVSGVDQVRALNYPSGSVRGFNPEVSTPGTNIELIDGDVWTENGAFDEFGQQVTQVCALGSASQVVGDLLYTNVPGLTGGVVGCNLDTGAVEVEAEVDGAPDQLWVDDDVLYVTGDLDFGPEDVGAAAFDATTGTPQPWSVADNSTATTHPLGGGAVAAAGGEVLLATTGATSARIEARGAGAALGPDGEIETWDPQVGGSIRSIEVVGDVAYIGGEFSSVAGTPRSNLAAVSTTTGALLPWNPQANGTVFDLRVVDGTVYVAGSFTEVSGQPRGHVAAISAEDGALTSFDPSFNNLATALAVAEDVVYVGGIFGEVGGLPRARLAAVDRSTGDPTPWNPGADDYVRAIEVDDDSIYVGGAFTTLGGTERLRVGAVGTDGDVLPWAPDVGGAAAEVWTLDQHDGLIYLGGTFSSVNAQPRSSLAAVDVDGLLSSWQPDPGGAVFAVSAEEGRVTAAGELLTNVAGVGAAVAEGLGGSGASGASGATKPTLLTTAEANDPELGDPPTPIDFRDVPTSHPFANDIDWMTTHQIASGFSDGTFRPGANVSRAAMSAFMHRLADVSDGFVPPSTPSFRDVGTSHPFYADIEWIAANGITTGFTDGTYRPSVAVSRGAMSAFMYRLAGEPPFAAPTDRTFGDVTSTHPFFLPIEWMANEGISTGTAASPRPLYRPAAAVSRGAMSAFMHRLADGPGVDLD